MNCPLCDKELSVDKTHKWILCSSENHKFKLTNYDDQTRKSLDLRMLSDSVLNIKGMTGKITSNPIYEGLIVNDENLKRYVTDKVNEALLNGQIHAYQMIAEYLRDDDYMEFIPE